MTELQENVHACQVLLDAFGRGKPGGPASKSHEVVNSEIGSIIMEKWVYPPENFCYHALCRKTWGTRQTLKDCSHELLFGETALNAPLGGKPLKRLGVLMAAMALLALLAGTALAETYVEGYIGNNFTVSSPNPLALDINSAYRGPANASLEYPRNLSSNVIGGGKLGIWFSKQGFPDFDYPDWMKYFGFYLDFNYHGIDLLPGIGSRRLNITPSAFPYYQNYKFYGNGSISTIGFMFAARYGFHPTEKVPFGKWQPYVAMGPAIMITTFKPTFMLQPALARLNAFFPIDTYDIPVKAYDSSKTVVSLGLETELGIRYMITRFLSTELSFKYRYTRPSLTYDTTLFGATHQLTFAPQFNLFSIQMGVAYHF